MRTAALILIFQSFASGGRRMVGHQRPLHAAGSISNLLFAFNPAVRSMNGIRPVERRARLDMTSTSSPSIRPDLAAAMGNEPASKFSVDEEKMFSEAKFAIPPEELISLAKAFTAAQIDGTADGNGGNPDWFASDFRFVAPVVGPYDKDEFIDSLKSFDIKEAFPDLTQNFHHWRVDPFEPNRVWYSVKYAGTNSGPILGQPATKKYIESPVQAQSVTFNEKGEVTKFTIGYVLDKEAGNTGGLGGVFGLFYACGMPLPFPEAKPYKPSPIFGALMKGTKVINGLQKSNPEVKQFLRKFVTTMGKWT